jgi:signal transduction histidine kinase
VIKHARAAAVTVDVRVGSGRLTLKVADDGVGADGSAGGNGMTNLRNRAESYGGDFTTADAHPHGTVLTWDVPLPG